MGMHQLGNDLEFAHLPSGENRMFNTPEGWTFGCGTSVPSAVAGWAPGAMYVDTDAGATSRWHVNTGTNTSCTFVVVPTPGTTFGFLGIPLNSFREAATFDVGAITANGGILASNTTPVLDAIDAATNGCQRILWASSNNDQVVTSVVLPPDFDDTADLILHNRIVSGGTTNAVGFTVETFFNEGDTLVSDTSGTNQTTTYAEVLTTIATADVPASQTITIGLTPVAHTTDTLAMTAAWLEYTKKTPA